MPNNRPTPCPSDTQPPRPPGNPSGQKDRSMKSKLEAFINRPVTLPPRLGSVGRYPDGTLAVVSKSRDQGRFYVRISLHSRAVQQLGWNESTKVSMRVIEGGTIVAYADGAGYTLSPNHKNKVSARWGVSIRVSPAFFDAVDPGIGRGVEIDKGMIAFNL